MFEFAIYLYCGGLFYWYCFTQISNVHFGDTHFECNNNFAILIAFSVTYKYMTLCFIYAANPKVLNDV